MSDQAKPAHSLLTWLLMTAGVLLFLAGGVSLLPTINAANEAAAQGAPADFGNDALPLRPTVTPLPRAGQSQITPEPALLPDTSRPVASAPVRKPTPVSLVGQNPSRIVIPAIKLDAPVETVGWHTVDGVSQWDVPDTYAAGWLMTSAPLGKPGNTAITGHHNVGGEVFRNLVKLQPGDRITLYADDQPFYYEVASRRILKERGQSDEVRRANARWIQSTNDERVTLITCWPYTSNTHRLVIVAKPIVPDKSDKSIEP